MSIRGITLIETVVYVALFSVIITGVMMSVYMIATMQYRTGTIVTLTQEKMFLGNMLEYIMHTARSRDDVIVSGTTINMIDVHNRSIILSSCATSMCIIDDTGIYRLSGDTVFVTGWHCSSVRDIQLTVDCVGVLSATSSSGVRVSQPFTIHTLL
jgi:hypothetical protein